MDSGCRKCGEEGHMARDCSIPDKCRKCNEEGHMAKDCTIPDKCMKCKKEGHIARDCELPDKCRNCGAEGHISRDCTEPVLCKRCNKEGHKANECEEEEQTREITTAEGEVKEIYVPKEKADDDLFEGNISSGINFDKYEHIPVDVIGKDVPPPMPVFRDLRHLLMDNIKKSKYQKPTPIQKNAIPIILARRDLMACAQTGSGKTAAFLLPILHNLLSSGADASYGQAQPQAVIVAPTRELACQINEQARMFSLGSGIKCNVVYGGTSVSFSASRIEKGCNILAATPGRLLDFVEKGKVSFARLEYFVLDEADRMLDMGFGPEIEKFLSHSSMPEKEKRTTLMFSATFPEEVRRKAESHLKEDKIFISVGLVGGTCSDVQQSFIKVEKKTRRSELMKIINDPERDPAQKILIFVNTKKNADYLASHLSSEDRPSTSIHGDRKQSQREEALHDFKTGKRPILVATAVAARGLDIPNVGHVVNYEMPSDVDEYVHRIGRTGRVGNLGKATSLYDPEYDSDNIGPLLDLLNKCKVEIPDFMVGGAGGSGDAAAGGAADDDDEW